MSIECPDVARLLAADMRWLLDEYAMAWLVRKCGGVMISNGEDWYIKIGGERIRDAARAGALNRALDLIATRPDLWPRPPSAA